MVGVATKSRETVGGNRARFLRKSRRSVVNEPVSMKRTSRTKMKNNCKHFIITKEKVLMIVLMCTKCGYHPHKKMFCTRTIEGFQFFTSDIAATIVNNDFFIVYGMMYNTPLYTVLVVLQYTTVHVCHCFKINAFAFVILPLHLYTQGRQSF